MPRVHPLQSGTTTTKAKNPQKVESVLCARKASIKPVRLKGVEDARKLFTGGKIFFVFFSWAY